MKIYMGIRNPRFRKIIRKRDSKGRILTYVVIHRGRKFEFNTLKEARRFAIII